MTGAADPGAREEGTGGGQHHPTRRRWGPCPGCRLIKRGSGRIPRRTDRRPRDRRHLPACDPNLGGERASHLAAPRDSPHQLARPPSATASMLDLALRRRLGVRASYAMWPARSARRRRRSGSFRHAFDSVNRSPHRGPWTAQSSSSLESEPTRRTHRDQCASSLRTARGTMQA